MVEKLTDAQIDALAGPELDARVLVALFGWRWMRSKRDGLCVLWPPEQHGPDEPFCGWVRTNFGPTSHEPFDGWPVAAERYDDWWGCLRHRDGWRQLPTPMPSPTTRAADDHEVLKVARAWDAHRLRRFKAACYAAWTARGADRPGWTAYEPGDYARAALDMLGVDRA